jgi:hypothetical protein
MVPDSVIYPVRCLWRWMIMAPGHDGFVTQIRHSGPAKRTSHIVIFVSFERSDTAMCRPYLRCRNRGSTARVG